jgi:hypothetical protein
MITTPHIIKPDAIIAFVDGKQYTVKADSIKYKDVITALNSGDESKFAEAVRQTEFEVINKVTGAAGFTLVNGIISLDGIEVIGALQTKLARLIKEGFDLSYLVNFVRRLRKNPSRTAVAELYDFLSYAELPITADGFLLAYKGIQDSYWSSTSGKTVLTSGTVDKSGYIFNGIGEKIRCERVEVDDDRRNACSNGLHVGSHDYAINFGSRTVVVKVDPADVVSVPLDCSCQKMRVAAYEVVADYVCEIKSAVADDSAQGVVSSRETLAGKVNDSVTSLRKRGGVITLKRLQSALSPLCPSLHDLRDIAARDLGFVVAIDKDSPTSVGSMFIP